MTSKLYLIYKLSWECDDFLKLKKETVTVKYHWILSASYYPIQDLVGLS